MQMNALTVETAHVLFLDIVGYSRQTTDAQARLVAELGSLVLGLPEVVRAQAAGELLVLPTGDGMALVFYRYPLAPVQTAVEIARVLSQRRDLPLRIGVHSGAVTRVLDAAGRENVMGEGINVAQRVMDCGDTGHILVSASVAQVLRSFDAWRDCLQDLGVARVKHGEELRVYNVCLESVGNPAVPSRLQDQPIGTPIPAPTGAPAGASPAGGGATDPSEAVALLYKRNAPDSAHLLGLLEPGLREAGYPVFIDRHLGVGVEWAQELKRRVSAARAVVVLLSAESIWSEMVEAEVQTAAEAQGRRGGLPRLLPVRVRYEGPLPPALDAALGALQYVLWRGPEDDAALLAAVTDALRTPARPAEPIGIDPAGGVVPLDSRFYVVRPTDTEFSQAVQRRESIVLVKGARQMGKTSLLTRGLQEARKAGLRCFHTDFQKLTAADLKDEESFFRALAERIADQLDLDTLPDEAWVSRRTGSFNFERYLRREVLGPSETHVVWALDEVDKLFACSYGSDVFALFRSWHNDRSYDPEGPWGRLTLAIGYATEAHLFITDVNQSPFNVGTRITLEDFTVGQVAELNGRYGEPLRSPSEVAAYHALTGGQPYLTRRGLDLMAEQGLPLAELAASADRDEGVFGDHLRRLLVVLTQDEHSVATARALLRGDGAPSAADFYRLRSGGLLSGSSPHDCSLRCRLYETYLRRHLL